MKIYLAGPMRGYPQFNFPAFKHYATILRAQGHEVFSPAEKDEEVHGADFAKGNETGSEEAAADTHGFSRRRALGDDMEWICKHADAVALMPGWGASKGATAERAVALALGLQVITLGEDA